MDPVLLSSKKMDWCTPKGVFAALNDEFHFVLDAAASDKNAKCSEYYTEKDDALIQSWNKGGAVFCNPPYGRQLGAWVKKAYEESKKMIYPVVLLVPARTDTSYFHEFIYGASTIRFIRGRLHFTDEDGIPGGRAPFPSMIVIYNYNYLLR